MICVDDVVKDDWYTEESTSVRRRNRTRAAEQCDISADENHGSVFVGYRHCMSEVKWAKRRGCLCGLTAVPGPERANDTSNLRETFDRLARAWSDETGAYSITSRRYAHPTYQAILALGRDVVPLILVRLKDRPDWWFAALTALAKPKVDPVRRGATFSESVDAWLEWGRQNGWTD